MNKQWIKTFYNKLIASYLPETLKKVGHHYGHPYMNTATIAGAFRMIIKRIAKERNKELKNYRNIPRRPWDYPKEENREQDNLITS